MPVHDWSRVRAGKFHHFHNSWIYKISDRLNGGILPPGFYAAGEQVVGSVEPDVLAFRDRGSPARVEWRESAGALAVSEQPPRVHHVVEGEQAVYLRKQDKVVIRASEGDRIVALIEVLSRGNKESRHEMDRLLRKVASALDLGYHMLIVDLHPPGSFDRHGIHGAVWEHLFGSLPGAVGSAEGHGFAEGFGSAEVSGSAAVPGASEDSRHTSASGDPSPEAPSRTLVSYRAGSPVTAYVEPLNVGDELPDMPLFLDQGWYVNAPLEETYVATWSGFPEPWKREMGS